VYEVIRERYPCRLYFDLEYSLLHNPTVDGAKLLSRWTKLVCWKLYEIYGITVHTDHVIDLDSSTAEKFSHHLTFLLPMEEEGVDAAHGHGHGMGIGGRDYGSFMNSNEILFLDNSHVGDFVRMILDDVDAETPSLPTMVAKESNSSDSSGTNLVCKETHVVVKDGRGGGESERNLLDEESTANARAAAMEQSFWVRNKDGKYVRFVDTSVYSRNRVFRLF